MVKNKSKADIQKNKREEKQGKFEKQEKLKDEPTEVVLGGEDKDIPTQKNDGEKIDENKNKKRFNHKNRGKFFKKNNKK